MQGRFKAACGLRAPRMQKGPCLARGRPQGRPNWSFRKLPRPPPKTRFRGRWRTPLPGATASARSGQFAFRSPRALRPSSRERGRRETRPGSRGRPQAAPIRLYVHAVSVSLASFGPVLSAFHLKEHIANNE